MLNQDNQSLNLPLQEWVLTNIFTISSILNPGAIESPNVTFERDLSNCRIQQFSNCASWNPGGSLK